MLELPTDRSGLLDNPSLRVAFAPVNRTLFTTTPPRRFALAVDKSLRNGVGMQKVAVAKLRNRLTDSKQLV